MGTIVKKVTKTNYEAHPNGNRIARQLVIYQEHSTFQIGDQISTIRVSKGTNC